MTIDALSKRLPRLLVISNHSGSESSVRPEAEIFLALRKQGFEIWLMTPAGGGYVQKAQSAGIHVIDFRSSSKLDITAILLIRKIVREHKIDIVHAFNGKALANSAWALTRIKAKLVGYRGYSGNIFWYDPSCYLHFLHPRVDAMVCLAESVREMFLEAGMNPGKAVTIHKGHDPSWYADIPAGRLDEFGVTNGNFVGVLVANKRTRMKGVIPLIHAVKIIADKIPIRLLMVGNGLRELEIENLITRLQLQPNIIFTGYRKDALSLVKSSDFIVSSSLFGEATQKSVIEGLFLSKPAIITDIPGNRGMVVNNESGLIVPEGNPMALAEAIVKLHQMTDEQRHTMGAMGRTHIANFLGHDKTVDDYKNLYLQLLV